MSRRRRGRAGERTDQSRADERPPRARAAPRGPGPAGGASLVAQVGILIAVVAVVTLIAEWAGAANVGVSLAIGTIAFAFVLMYLMLAR